MQKMNPKQKKLVEDNINFARWLAHNWASTQSKIDYDELESAAFYSLVKSAITYNKDKNTQFNTYARLCIENNFKNMLKKAKKAPILISEKIENEFLDDFDISTTIDLKQILDIIPSNDKELFQDFYINGYTQQEIAKKYNISQTSVSNIIKKIKNVIAEYIE